MNVIELNVGSERNVIVRRCSGRCCVAVKFRCGYLRCNRKRSQIVLNAHLEGLTLLKKLNIAISDEDPHMGICLFHWRMIKYGRPGIALTTQELNSWEADETRLGKSERSEDSPDIMVFESSTSSEREESDDDLAAEDRVTSQKGKLNWREVDIKRRKIKSPSEDRGEGEEHRDSEEEDERSGLCTLSAASLRRYRKFFMIPTKASASKHAMLEGVESHFERLPVRASDAIVHFIYTAKNRMNTVE
ncbi:hypothetical protein Y032_0029g1903 [Ancylostoma ceylanicum]|uniref:Histone deacetylase complex subunit SAP30 Sin3 binding domain-containing protein n=1 Tax=Ancylostoma ceylanicum TaxID=53326 RepID=A0A016USC8_9BILA|nr:hypothetical protein Y032_0029g1903 [Ancylostoma ceylanicum]